jgi:hypothetical protein
LQQEVGETGWQLSHGEKSRLYIARALLQGADLIILGRPKHLTRSNYMTERTRKLHNQELDACLWDLPRVTLGYEFLKEATEIRVVIAYPRTRWLAYEWWYPLSKP